MLSGQAVPAVPGGCSELAGENIGKPGCFLSTLLTISEPPATMYWHIAEFPDEVPARSAARGHEWATVVPAHGRWWLYVLSSSREEKLHGHVRGLVSPFQLIAGQPVIARFMESTFPPGMRTRVHSHSGPEAFFVIEGEQCVSTSSGDFTIQRLNSRIVDGGAHLQAASKGRKSLVLIIAPPNQPWMKLEADDTLASGCQ